MRRIALNMATDAAPGAGAAGPRASGLAILLSRLVVWLLNAAAAAFILPVKQGDVVVDLWNGVIALRSIVRAARSEGARVCS